MITLQIILFSIFALIAIVSSVLVVTRKNPIISALFLVLNFAALAGIYLLLNAQFIAVVQVIVYAGAIMVLFLFVIMLLRPEHEKNFFEENPKMKWLALTVGSVVFFQLIYTIFFGKLSSAMHQNAEKSVQIGTVESIGRGLFTTYLIPFEAACFLLLAAAIGALVLAKKHFD